MSPQARALFEAHVAHELARLDTEALSAMLTEEIGLLFDWLDRSPLQEIATPDAAERLLRRYLVDAPVTDALMQSIGSITLSLIQAPINRQTRVEDVLREQDWQRGTELVVGMRGLREDLIRQAMSNPLAPVLVAETLYTGIRDYATEQSAALSKKVPGVGSLFNKGAEALSKRAPNLEGAMEQRVRGFIERNMQATLASSEKFLLEYLTDARIREFSGSIWKGLRGSSLSIERHVDEAGLAEALELGREVWLHLRQSDYFATMLRSGIEQFYADHGDKPAGQILAELGYEREKVLADCEAIVPELLTPMRESGYLRQVIETRFRSFYRSPQAAELLAG